MKYIQLCKNGYLDCRDYQFVPEEKRIRAWNVDVPFYLWTFNEPDIHKDVYGVGFNNGRMMNTCSFWRKLYELELNKLEIKFGRGYIPSTIQFINPKTNEWETLELLATSDTSGFAFGDESKMLTGIDFRLEVAGNGPVTTHVQLDEGRMHHNMFGQKEDVAVIFNRIVSLGCQEAPKYSNHQFSYGVRSLKYAVMYHKQKLEDLYLALVAGPWAILLNDDFSFNTLCYLRGISANTLFVEKFAYTVSTKILKASVLKS